MNDEVETVIKNDIEIEKLNPNNNITFKHFLLLLLFVTTAVLAFVGLANLNKLTNSQVVTITPTPENKLQNVIDAKTPIPTPQVEINTTAREAKRKAIEAANSANSVSYVANSNQSFVNSQKYISLIPNGQYLVKGYSYRWFEFTLNETSKVVGEFAASGGSNDINVLVMDLDEFMNFKNNKEFRSFYHSDYVTTGYIDLQLPAGKYVLVMNNLKALLTNKMIQANLRATSSN